MSCLGVLPLMETEQTVENRDDVRQQVCNMLVLSIEQVIYQHLRFKVCVAKTTWDHFVSYE